jgi:salicylate hydroxylase
MEEAAAQAAPATSDEIVEAFSEWDDRVAAMLSTAEGDTTKWAVMFGQLRDPVWGEGHALLGDAAHAMRDLENNSYQFAR